MTQSANVTIATVMSIFTITSIAGNSLVCFVVVRNRDMRIPINYLVVNLAVADIIWSMFLLPHFILSHIISNVEEEMTGNVICRVLQKLAWIGGDSSVFTLIAIARERFYSVIYPLGDRGKLTMCKLKVIIPGSWIFSLIFNIRELMLPSFVQGVTSKSCKYVWPDEWMKKTYRLTWLAFVATSSTLVAGLYSRVVYTLWFKRKKDDMLTYQQQGVLRVRKRVTLMVVTVTAIFGICWITDAAVHTVQDFASFKLSSTAIPIAHTVILFSSAVNPFAYALISQRFREKMKVVDCCSSKSSEARVHAARKPDDIELASNPSLPHLTRP